MHKVTMDKYPIREILPKIENKVERWIKTKYPQIVQRRGSKPKMFDFQVIAISLLIPMFFKSEREGYHFLKTNFPDLYAEWNEYSRFNRRAKDLSQLMLTFPVELSKELESEVNLLILDSEPVPVCKRFRAGRSSHWAISASEPEKLYGFCAAKQEKFYGYRLHLAVNQDGVICNYVLAPAAHHDISVAPELIEHLQKTIIIADKGYIGLDMQYDEKHIITPKRKNMSPQNTDLEKIALRYRRRIETVNSQLVKMNIQNHKAKSFRGLKSRITYIIAATGFAQWFNLKYPQNNQLAI